MFSALRHGKIMSRTHGCYSTRAPLTRTQLSRSYAVADANLPSPVYKICSKCQISKLLDRFPRDKTGRFGYLSYCKDCKKAHSAAHRRLTAAFSQLAPIDPTPRAPVTSKVCRKCRLTKALEQFAPDTRYLHGRRSCCRACRQAYVRQWGEHNSWKNRQTGTAPSKVCKKCGIEKPAAEFPSAYTQKDGLGSRCRQCRSESDRSGGRRATPEFRLKARLQHLYDMSIDQYAAMLKAQNGECAICKTALGSKPNVDHCHVSRKVRGLLCSRCNSWLAAIEHPTFPLRALEYLGRFT